MTVLDASAVIELLLNLPLGAQVRRRIAEPDEQLHAPQLLVVEVLQVLRRRVSAGITEDAQAQTAIALLQALDVTYHDHLLLAPRIWSLHENVTAYDAAYLALAELLDQPLLTTDARLARAPGSSAGVELINNQGAETERQ